VTYAKRCRYLDLLQELLDKPLSILNYNLQSSSINYTLQFTIHSLGFLSLLSLARPLIPASNGGIPVPGLPMYPHAIATTILDSQCTYQLHLASSTAHT
jgi:hypothetical protein